MKDLDTKNLRIRKFKIEDAEDIYKNLATERKLEKCLGYNLHKSVEETKSVVSSYIYEYEANELAWAIEEKQSNSAIGYINALEVSTLKEYCNIKFGISFKYVEKHYMEEALNCVLEYIFNEKKFNMVVSKFYDGNKEITNYKTIILEGIGMKKEAVLRNRKINEKTGMVENQVIYSITKDEFFEFNDIDEYINKEVLSFK